MRFPLELAKKSETSELDKNSLASYSLQCQVVLFSLATHMGSKNEIKTEVALKDVTGVIRG